MTISNYLKNELFEGIVSKQEFLELNDKNLIKKDGCVLIAIHNPDEEEHSPEVVEGFDDVLQIKFWDLEQTMGDKDPISAAKGAMLYKFILKHEDKKFLIHCNAGISRSAGVGLAVECIINYQDSKRDFALSRSSVKCHGRYSPNYKVYNEIL